MTDTKMKTLGELAKELRFAACDNGGMTAGLSPHQEHLAEAADRLERIEKAWRDWIAAQKTGDEAQKQPALSALRDLIEGEP